MIYKIITELAGIMRKNNPDMSDEEIHNLIIAQVRDILGGLEWRSIERCEVIPDFIWLQVDSGDVNLSTWSANQVNDNDICYVRTYTYEDIPKNEEKLK